MQTHNTPEDRRTFTVVVDFAGGQISPSMQDLLANVVEFIQEDVVSADDSNAMVCAEALAKYLATGETGHIAVDNR